MSRSRKIRLPIFGLIDIPDWLIQIIDHPLFQRLRWVSQMSLGQLIYPGAVHSRFEHSLGTMYLAKVASQSIIKFIFNENFLNLEEIKLVRDEIEKLPEGKETFKDAALLVGLLHDVGHGPFSHVLEYSLIGTNFEYDHEKIGFKVSQIILNKCANDKIENCRHLVLPVLDKSLKLDDLTPLQRILRTLIDSDIDIDKEDYIVRNSYHCGAGYGSYGVRRLWHYLAIASEDRSDLKRSLKTAILSKAYIEAYHLLISRYHIYSAVCHHHARLKLDAMFQYLIRDIAINFSEEIEGTLLPFLTKDGHLDETQSETFFQGWNDGSFIASLLKFYSKKEIYSSLFQRIWNRKLLKESEILESKRISYSNKEEKKAIVKCLHKFVSKINENSPSYLATFSAISPELSFPISKLKKILVVDVDKEFRVKSLYNFLNLGSYSDQDPEHQDILNIKIYVDGDYDRNLNKFRDEWLAFEEEYLQKESPFNETLLN